MRLMFILACSIGALWLGLQLDGIWILALPTLASVALLILLISGWLSPLQRPIERPPQRECRPPASVMPPIFEVAQAASTPHDQSGHDTSRKPLHPGFPAPDASQRSIHVRVTSAQPARRAAPRLGDTVPMRRETRLKLDASHYLRHMGVPGYIYVAHNDCHRRDLFKVGYTLQDPLNRIEQLNEQHAKASDVGAFSLVHAAAVAASYDTEQALFDSLAPWRVTLGREFFAVPVGPLCEALDAAARLDGGSLEPLAAVVATLDHPPEWLGQAKHPKSVGAPPSQNREGGWVYICRNSCHRPSIRRLGFTHSDPISALAVLNAPQRLLTSQIGFYRLEVCVATRDPGAVLRRARTTLRQHLVHARRQFFDCDSVVIERAIRDAAAQVTPTTESAAEGQVSDITATELASSPHPSWAAWVAPCPTCGVLHRFTGKIGARTVLSCPACAAALSCGITSRGVSVSDGVTSGAA